MSQANRATKQPKKPAEGGITKSTQLAIPNSRLYTCLRELDLRVEQYTNRRKAEATDLSRLMDLSLRCLRLQLHNTHSNQGSTDPSNPPSWTFYIHGTFIDQNQVAGTQLAPAAGPSDNPAQVPGQQQHQQQQHQRVTADRNWTAAMAVVQLRIEDPSKPDAPADIVRWERARHVGQHREQIEVHRTGTAPAKIYITMERDFAPEWFTVTGALARALSLDAGTRGQVLRKLREWAAQHSTPDPANPAILNADAELQALLQSESSRIDVADLASCLDAHLQPLAPVALEYTVQLDGASPCAPACYDVDVAWSLKPGMLRLPPHLERLDMRAQFDALDESIASALQALKAAQRRRRFLVGFATDPAQWTRRFIAASAREVRHRDGAMAELSAGDNFKQPWAQEAAAAFLDRRERA